ncbi:MAG: hypothetical protein E6J98_00370 [Methanobacteriota archaeon]|nr:MAG: hypothetical protein E6J98_00370 [Euryarchaeota archaeon]
MTTEGGRKKAVKTPSILNRGSRARLCIASTSASEKLFDVVTIRSPRLVKRSRITAIASR